MLPNIFLMADPHGSWKPIRDFYQRNPKIAKAAARNQENVLILLGDAGLNFFFNHRDEEFKTKLGKYPFTYFVIRGNHEERPSICSEKYPDKWHLEEYFDGLVWVENDYPYIKYAMDYMSVYNIPYKQDYIDPEKPENDDIEVTISAKTLVIPGAYSVDKYHRLQMGWSWFENEQLSQEEMEIGFELLNLNNWKFDLVLSHTCPICYEPTDLFISSVNQSMVDKSMERYLGRIEYQLDYKLWVFGHFHAERVYPKVDNKQIMMLYNTHAINLADWIEGDFGQFY